MPDSWLPLCQRSEARSKFRRETLENRGAAGTRSSRQAGSASIQHSGTKEPKSDSLALGCSSGRLVLSASGSSRVRFWKELAVDQSGALVLGVFSNICMRTVLRVGEPFDGPASERSSPSIWSHQSRWFGLAVLCTLTVQTL